VVGLRSDVVALYVDPNGPYPSRVVDWYDEARDARTYAGDLPVVAHPPCGPWGRLRHMSKHDDPTHAPAAVKVVRRLGGILEHPSGSKLWDHCKLPKPHEGTDVYGGFTVQIDQVRWGHVAQKRTWLYVVRPTKALPIPRARVATKCVSRDAKRKSSRLPRCSAFEARATPPAFADWLLEIASSCTLDSDANRS
jgi:hypothetical protein